MQDQLEAATGQFQEKLDAVEQINAKLQDDKHLLNETLNEVENNVELKNEQIYDLQNEKFALNGNVAILE